MAPRDKNQEKQVINELPDEFKILKMDVMDYAFSKAQADYYFSLLLGLDVKRSQPRTEELFRRGALIKIHSEKDNKPTLYPAPPTFMFFIDELGIGMVKKHKKTIEKLEDMYYERFCNTKDSFLKQKQIFVTGRGEFFVGFKMFMIKKYTKEQTYMNFMDADDRGFKGIKLALGEEVFSKTTIMLSSNIKPPKVKGHNKLITIDERFLCKERIVIIDDKFAMNFFSLRDSRNRRLLSGYMTNFIQDIKKLKEKFIFLCDQSKEN